MTNDQPLEIKQDLTKAKYIVSFISLMSSDTKGYDLAASQMMNAVKSQPGFIAVYSAKNEDGLGMTNSYWSSLDAIAAWKENSAHQVIQQKGQSTWYAWYQLQVCEIIRSY